MVINSLRRLVTGILNLAEMVKIMMLTQDGRFRRNQSSVNLIIVFDKWYIENLVKTCIFRESWRFYAELAQSHL